MKPNDDIDFMSHAPSKAHIPETLFEFTGKARAIQRSAVFGESSSDVQWVKVLKDDPDVFGLLVVMKALKTKRKFKTIVSPLNDGYVTIEVAGKTVWDSRAVIPCDTEKWGEIWSM